MRKTLITSVTAFAIILSAGMSVAGPLRNHSQRGLAQDVRSSVSQTFDVAGTTANNNQTDKMSASVPGSVFMCSRGGPNKAFGSDHRCSFDLYPNIPGH